MKCIVRPEGDIRIHHNPLFIYMITTLCLAVFLASGCSNDSTGGEASASTKKARVKVNTAAVQALKVARPVILSGFTEPVRRSTPAARVMAKVLDADFREGDRVAGDCVLIRLDTQDLLARKRQAAAAFDTASTALDVAQLDLDRMRNLYTSQTVSRHQMETAQVAHARANAAKEAAKAAIEEIDVNLSYSIARAPFAGIIVRKMVEVGNMVAPGQPLFIIEDDSRLRIIAPVGSDLAAGLKPSDTLMLRIEGRNIQGTIEGVMSSGSTQAPGQRVQLLIDNQDRRFKAGTLAEVEVPQGQPETAAIFIPKSALIEKGRLTGAFVVTSDFEARLHWLIIGEDRGKEVGVLAGLHEGDRVILLPEQAGIRDGQPVEEINP